MKKTQRIMGTVSAVALCTTLVLPQTVMAAGMDINSLKSTIAAQVEQDTNQTVDSLLMGQLPSFSKNDTEVNNENDSYPQENTTQTVDNSQIEDTAKDVLEENTVSAVIYKTEGNFKYEENSKKVTIKGLVDPNVSEVEIPATINGYPVVSIEKDAFNNNTAIKSVKFNSAVDIGNSYSGGAFSGCTSLTSVTLSSTPVQDVDPSIGCNTFYGCTSLSSIVIPGIYKNVYQRAFEGCVSLKSVEYKANSAASQKIDSYAFRGCTKLTDIQLADSVTEIGFNAFSGCTSLVNIKLPSGLVNLGAAAFKDCTSLKSVEIGANIANFGARYSEGVFENCTRLTDVTIKEGTSEVVMNNSAFKGCKSLENIVIPGNYITIGTSCFKECESLKSVEWKSGVKSKDIESSAFEDCGKLSKVVLPDTLTQIDTKVFKNCTLLSDIYLPGTLANIGAESFRDCVSLKSINIPASVTTIGGSYSSGAFQGCTNLENVAFDEGISAATISDSSFKDCTSLKSLSIPGNYTVIGSSAFENCTSLKQVKYAFNDITNSSQIIKNSAFKGCLVLETIDLSESLETIERDAFKDCKALKEAIIPEGVVNIYDTAFANCISLTKVVIPSTVTSLGDSYYNSGVFNGCRELTDLTIKEGTLDAIIYGSAFKDCKALTYANIPANYTEIGNAAFSGCTSLKVFIYNGGAYNFAYQAVDYNLFKDCENLAEVILPDTLKTVGADLFVNCDKLYDITIPESVTTIDTNAFRNSKLRTIYNKSAVAASLPKVDKFEWYNKNTGEKVTTITSAPAIAKSTLQGTTVYDGVDYSAVYDMTYYADHNPDVYEAYGYDENLLLWHFVTFGMPEGRVAIDNFNVVNYMYCLLNDDLRATFGGDMRSYYLHYMNYGRYEGRSVSDYDNIFDPAYYIASNPDVYNNIVSRYTNDGNTLGWALWHYYEYGMNEGRKGSPNFGVLNYEAANPDIWQAYGENYRQATIHRMQYGQDRPITCKYDIYSIPETRPDVVAAYGMNPQNWISWYVTTGQYE